MTTMDELDLRTVFEELSTRGGPPHGLTPDAVVAAGKRVRRRRRVLAAGLAGTAVAVVATVPVLLGLVPTAGRTPEPGTRGVPPASTGSPSPPAPGPTPRPRWCHVPNNLPPPELALCAPLGGGPVESPTSPSRTDQTKKDVDEKTHDTRIRGR
ncbi:MAG: hypothetical protein ACJ73S_14060 [Mycobacteriales bacterium]